MGGIKYNQDTARTISNTARGNIINKNVNFYQGPAPEGDHSPGSRSEVLAAYLASTGKTAAQLAKELSTTAGNVKGWLRGCEIEVDYWIQLKPLLEDFLPKKKPSPFAPKNAPSCMVFTDADQRREVVSVDEAMLVKKYRLLFDHQKLRIHREIDQMGADNIDEQWRNMGLREDRAPYGRTFVAIMTADRKIDLDNLLCGLDETIKVANRRILKSGGNTHVLSLSTCRAKEDVEALLRDLSARHNCRLDQITEGKPDAG